MRHRRLSGDDALERGRLTQGEAEVGFDHLVGGVFVRVTEVAVFQNKIAIRGRGLDHLIVEQLLPHRGRGLDGGEAHQDGTRKSDHPGQVLIPADRASGGIRGDVDRRAADRGRDLESVGGGVADEVFRGPRRRDSHGPSR
jgi:hypothetical protein